MMSEKNSISELLNEMVNKISQVMAIMEMFKPSRPGSIAFTKLEEAMMWLQVLTVNIPLKQKNDDNEDEAKEEKKIIID